MQGTVKLWSFLLYGCECRKCLCFQQQFLLPALLAYSFLCSHICHSGASRCQFMQPFITTSLGSACQTPQPKPCIDIRLPFHADDWRLPFLLDKWRVKKDCLLSYAHGGPSQVFLQNSHGMPEKFAFITSGPNLRPARWQRVYSGLSFLPYCSSTNPGLAGSSPVKPKTRPGLKPQLVLPLL